MTDPSTDRKAAHDIGSAGRRILETNPQAGAILLTARIRRSMDTHCVNR